MNFLGRMKQRLVLALGGEYKRVTYGLTERGYVAWDMNPPVNVNFQLHKCSIIDAIETASNFLGTDYAHEREWILTGLVGRAVLNTLPQVELHHNDGLFDGPRWKGFTFLGTLGHRNIHYASGAELNCQLIVFNAAKRFVRVEIVNASTVTYWPPAR